MTGLPRGTLQLNDGSSDSEDLTDAQERVKWGRRAEKVKTGGYRRTGQKLRARRAALEVCPIAQRYGSEILGHQRRDGCRDILEPT
ncbi:unnamed protein product [Trichogramma brassicae]|uniref:Uncharacterized protein n=1 Tax=Trichogramma brassicae TaxID=86971 RepID=A0A6H5I169_9HYME|nr:unnamed protein product [Trichogramma brassicae]